VVPGKGDVISLLWVSSFVEIVRWWRGSCVKNMKKWLWVASSCMVFSLVGIGLVGTAAACTWDVGSPFLAGNPQQDEPPVEATFPDAVHLAVRQVTRDPELGPEDSCGSVGVVQIGV